MTLSDKPALARELDRMFATWLKPSPTPRIVDAAYAALEHFDFDDFETAISALIAVGGPYLPSIAVLRDECRRAEHASRRRYAVPDQADEVCPRCEGIGQYQTVHTETYAYQVVGHAPSTLKRTYAAPCPDCARGRKILACREAARHDTARVLPSRRERGPYDS